MTAEPTTWTLAAPFLHDSTERWLIPFVPNEDGAFRFQSVAANYSHDRSKKFTSLDAWRDYFKHGGATWNTARQARGGSGILTCFPQLPIAVGLRKRLSFCDVPLVAWTFNLGKLYPGARRRLARLALRSVDRFIVHSRSEVTAYSNWLQLPAERFQFVPLQRATRPIKYREDFSHPFLLSMGSAQRDYRLLFNALAELRYPTVVVAGQHAVAGLTIPSNVEVRSGLSTEQCHELVQRARLSVVPVSNQDTASGQVTLLDAMMFARPVVITACPASVDYVTDQHDAMLVRHGDHDDMKSAIQRLWEDAPMRQSIGEAARRTAMAKFSDEAIGVIMGSVLREVGAMRIGR